jgi:hypothetical protein
MEICGGNMSVTDEIATSRAKSIILNHWIYNYLPFGAIFSSIRLSSFSPIATWFFSWLILGVIYSSMYTCADDALCSSVRKQSRYMHYLSESGKAKSAKLTCEFDKGAGRTEECKEYEVQEYQEPFEQGVFIKDICSLLMFLNLPGLMGGMTSAYTIKSARKH